VSAPDLNLKNGLPPGAGIMTLNLLRSFGLTERQQPLIPETLEFRVSDDPRRMLATAASSLLPPRSGPGDNILEW
jgi:hypothetical protein